MAQLFEVKMPSVGTNGQAVLVGTTATTLHTAITGTTQADEVWVWVSNYHASSTSNVTVTVGGVTLCVQAIPALSQVQLVVPGIRLNNGLTVTATSSVASAVAAVVNVNRITL